MPKRFTVTAKEIITCSCGHDQVFPVIAEYTEPTDERRKKWIANPCSMCRMAKNMRERHQKKIENVRAQLTRHLESVQGKVRHLGSKVSKLDAGARRAELLPFGSRLILTIDEEGWDGVLVAPWDDGEVRQFKRRAPFGEDSVTQDPYKVIRHLLWSFEQAIKEESAGDGENPPDHH